MNSAYYLYDLHTNIKLFDFHKNKTNNHNFDEFTSLISSKPILDYAQYILKLFYELHDLTFRKNHQIQTIQNREFLSVWVIYGFPKHVLNLHGPNIDFSQITGLEHVYTIEQQLLEITQKIVLLFDSFLNISSVQLDSVHTFVHYLQHYSSILKHWKSLDVQCIKQTIIQSIEQLEQTKQLVYNGRNYEHLNSDEQEFITLSENQQTELRKKIQS